MRTTSVAQCYIPSTRRVSRDSVKRGIANSKHSENKGTLFKGKNLVFAFAALLSHDTQTSSLGKKKVFRILSSDRILWVFPSGNEHAISYWPAPIKKPLEWQRNNTSETIRIIEWIREQGNAIPTVVAEIFNSTSSAALALVYTLRAFPGMVPLALIEKVSRMSVSPPNRIRGNYSNSNLELWVPDSWMKLYHELHKQKWPLIIPWIQVAEVGWCMNGAGGPHACTGTLSATQNRIITTTAFKAEFARQRACCVEGCYGPMRWANIPELVHTSFHEIASRLLNSDPPREAGLRVGFAADVARGTPWITVEHKNRALPGCTIVESSKIRAYRFDNDISDHVEVGLDTKPWVFPISPIFKKLAICAKCSANMKPKVQLSFYYRSNNHTYDLFHCANCKAWNVEYGGGIEEMAFNWDFDQLTPAAGTQDLSGFLWKGIRIFSYGTPNCPIRTDQGIRSLMKTDLVRPYVARCAGFNSNCNHRPALWWCGLPKFTNITVEHRIIRQLNVKCLCEKTCTSKGAKLYELQSGKIVLAPCWNMAQDWRLWFTESGSTPNTWVLWTESLSDIRLWENGGVFARRIKYFTGIDWWKNLKEDREKLEGVSRERV